MPEMEYGQQAFSAMQAAEAARAAEARMNDEGEGVASQGDAPDTAKAIKDQEAMLAERLSKSPRPEVVSAPSEDEEEDAPKLTGAALKARAAELGIEGGMTADETRAAIADAEADEEDDLELFGVSDPDADPEE